MGSFFIVFCALHPISNLLRASGIFPLASFFLRSSVSNSFFYRNPKIKEEVHKAVDIQNQSYKMNIDEVELLDEYKEKLLAMRIEIIKLKAENQKLESELDFLRRQQEGVSDVK